MTAFVQIVIGLLGAFMFANGIYMLYDPLAWYLMVPTVPATGPFNQHFLRDIGTIHLMIGAGYIIGMFLPRQRLWMWSAATLWLALHGFFHVWEIAVGICSTDVIAQNWFAVYLPAVIGLAGVVWVYFQPPKDAQA
ncbi:hypothetical protein UP10_13405 [Bradyrhizobium sp. LTSPM299]|uniref:hypothetical protein n=1 Tax=Bradyrhizobium sp. LTSPM299 TaxID=1619233 RepID=UPI0005C9282A|nr:hypothetical protein [Bradyrhizobium sp. LTSPM299]KJC60332.1 hypothetical protein UP10_13405 [Bradyrhizobium sp. LTSPM299]